MHPSPPLRSAAGGGGARVPHRLPAHRGAGPPAGHRVVPVRGWVASAGRAPALAGPAVAGKGWAGLGWPPAGRRLAPVRAARWECMGSGEGRLVCGAQAARPPGAPRARRGTRRVLHGPPALLPPAPASPPQRHQAVPGGGGGRGRAEPARRRGPLLRQRAARAQLGVHGGELGARACRSTRPGLSTEAGSSAGWLQRGRRPGERRGLSTVTDMGCQPSLVAARLVAAVLVGGVC